jgi:hypothetical protein
MDLISTLTAWTDGPTMRFEVDMGLGRIEAQINRWQSHLEKGKSTGVLSTNPSKR